MKAGDLKEVVSGFGLTLTPEIKMHVPEGTFVLILDVGCSTSTLTSVRMLVRGKIGVAHFINAKYFKQD